MPNTQYLACLTTKEYLDTDKFCPDDRFEKEYHGTFHTDAETILKTVEKTKAEISRDAPYHYWVKFFFQIKQMVERHADKELVIIKGGGNLPWFGPAPNWYDWKKLGFSTEFDRDTELPRNIIDDLEIRDWESALEHYKTNCVFVDEPQRMKQAFMKHLDAAHFM